MLSAAHRLTDPEGFRVASRRGRRAGSRTVVAHLLLPDEQQAAGVPGTERPTEVRVGFVVSKAVGTAVVRNLVKRRLRNAVRERIAALPRGSRLVVRALPAAAGASYAALESDLDHCLGRVAASPRDAR